MNTPTHPFDLQLAKLGWPLVNERGQSAKFLTDEVRITSFQVCCLTDGQPHLYRKDGGFATEGAGPLDLHLSADYSREDVRQAVKKAFEAGEKVLRRAFVASYNNNIWCELISSDFNWLSSDDYRLARHVEQPAQPVEPPKQIAEGHNSDGLTPQEVGEDYALLNLGDSIRGGDQYRDDGNWIEGIEILGRVCKYSPPFRRLVTPQPFTPPPHPDSRKWHKPEALTEADWKAGWRPLMENEETKEGDELRAYASKEWRPVESTLVGSVICGPLRTKRPLKHEERRLQKLHRKIIAIAKLWPGHEGVNYDTTSTADLCDLIADAVTGDLAKIAKIREVAK